MRTLSFPTAKRFGSKYFLLSLGGVLVTLACIYVGHNGISYREVIAAAVVAGGLWVFAAGHRGLEVGFVLVVATFGLGYRTMDVTERLRIHPSELILWGLLALVIVHRRTAAQGKLNLWIPPWVALLLPFLLWGWWPLLLGWAQWDTMFSEFKNFVVLIPLCFLASTLLAHKTGWRSMLIPFYLVGAWVAAMGTLEHLYPDAVKAAFPGFVGVPTALETDEGFQRASFSFWGSQDAIYICVLAMPLAAAVWCWWSETWKRVLNIFILGILLSAIYISGHRNAWMMAVLQFLGFAILKKKYVLAVALLFGFFTVYQVLPNEARDRINSAVDLAAGNPVSYDTSGHKRWERVLTSINHTLEQPLGRGWTAAGWVHNDFLQVAENLGIVAGILFLGGYILTLGRLSRRVGVAALSSEHRTVGTVLLISFACAGFILATDASSELPQYIIPIWFVWVLVEIWLRQTSMKRGNKGDTHSNLRALANVQLRADRSRYPRIRQLGRRNPGRGFLQHRFDT